MSTTTTRSAESEVTIFTRILGNDQGRLSPDLARDFLGLDFSDRDKARMHDLAARNQDGALSPAEHDELLAIGKAGDLLAILKSRTRRAAGCQRRMIGTLAKSVTPFGDATPAVIFQL